MRERDETLLVDLIAIRADRQPDLDVLTFECLSADGRPDEIRTYGDLHRNGQRIAAWPIARGLAPGERFALMMRNHPEFVQTMIAASTSACVMVPIDPRTRGEKLAYTLRDAGCRGIVCADYCLDALRPLRSSLPDLDWVLTPESGEEGARAPLGPGEESLAGVLAGLEVDVPLRAVPAAPPCRADRWCRRAPTCQPLIPAARAAAGRRCPCARERRRCVGRALGVEGGGGSAVTRRADGIHERPDGDAHQQRQENRRQRLQDHRDKRHRGGDH
jgi:hypothetical protein